MKMRNIITEIGDSSIVVNNAKFDINENRGKVSFRLLENSYEIDIRSQFKVNIGHPTTMILIVSFSTNETGSDLTNKGQPLKVMSNVVGGIEEWIKRYNKRFGQTEIVYIKYDPKSESDEQQDFDKISKSNSANKRDRLYRVFIEKFSKRYNSTVSFTTQGGVVAKFEPYLKVQ